MAKRIKLTKQQQKKLSKSWIGIIIILLIAGYNFYLQNKPIPKGQRLEVTLEQCVDGDTAWFDIDGKKTKVRFLYIDTPESTNKVEAYGLKAKAFTENELTKAKKIELELNVDGDQNDKYDRLLAWVFVDGKLLQAKLAEAGLVEKFYDYGYDYTYKREIISADNEAKKMKKGLYSSQ